MIKYKVRVEHDFEGTIGLMLDDGECRAGYQLSEDDVNNIINDLQQALKDKIVYLDKIEKYQVSV